MHLDVNDLSDIHPALLDSAVHWRGVGGWGVTATLMRTISAGALCVGVSDGLLRLRLVGGVSTSRHPLPHGPFVKQGHIDCLESIDRHLLVMVMDEIARSAITDVSQIASYARAHPVSFWRRLRVWRDEVDMRATKLLQSGALAVSYLGLQSTRSALVDSLYDSSLSDADWSRIAGAALVAGLDDVVVKSAHDRQNGHTAEWLTGPDAVVWLACVTSGRRSGLDLIRRVFSPFRPSSYPPAQYAGIKTPFWYRVRSIDDGSQRLGG